MEEIQNRKMNNLNCSGGGVGGGMSDVVLECVMPYIHDPRDRDAVSLVCRRWYELDALTRKHVTIALCYSTSPDRLQRRFKHLESLKMKGKPRAAMFFNLIPDDWGGFVTPWVNEIAESFNCLKSLHFRRMIVKDSDLELLASSRGKVLQVLKLDKCSGFSTDGLTHIGRSCRQLRTLFLEESAIAYEKDGDWLHELATNNTVLETLNFYMTDLTKVRLEDLELLAKNCRSLVSVKISDCEILELVGFFRAASAIEEFCGGSFNEPDQPGKYSAVVFPPKLCRLGLSYMEKNVMSIVFPFASLLKKLDLLYVLLGTEDHCVLVQRCPNLEVLETRNVIGDRGLEALARSCKRLKRLRIERGADEQEMEDVDGRVSQRGLIALAQGCLELEYIAVYVSDISNAALEHMGAYSKNLNDFRLVLLEQEDRITDLPLDNGVRALLRGCEKLQRFGLYLRSGGLTDVGLGYIGQYSRHVRWMILGSVGESDEGLLAFSMGCPSLQKLEMRACCFTERALARAALQLTSLRGDLNLTLLPASGLRLSFIGDDGSTERLFTLSSKTHCPAVEVHEIPADSSGRSFNLKISDGRVFYFWCSEKSKLLGIELLAKMKDVLKRKPSIADLTGISKSRLDCFATHLRAFLVGSNGREISTCSLATSSTTPDVSDSTSTTKSLRSRHTGSLAVKTNSAYQGSLSPRSSSFKEGLPRSLSSSRNATREKLRRRVDNHLSAVDNIMAALPLSIDVTCNQSGNEKLQEAKSCPLAPSSVLESLGKLSLPPIQLPVSHVLSSPHVFSPYYCWCPQGTSSLQYPSTPSEISTSSVESPLLPPFPPLLSSSRPSNLLSPIPPLSLADFPSLDFPALLPDPLVRLPIPSSQQIPTFTPLMCDPIVHIPLIDVCSSGQGYLVSAGPTIAGPIPPLHPRLVNPLIPETAESVVEKGARETLRLLISSTSQTNSQFMNVLPVVLTNTDQTSILAGGSWSLYTGTRDVDAIANRIATMGLVSLSESSIGNSVADISGGCDNTNALPDNLPDGSSVLGGPYSEDEGTMFSNAGKGTN